MRFRMKNMLAALGLAASLITPALAQDTFQPTELVNRIRRMVQQAGETGLVSSLAS